ncbi:ceramide kinase-like isoform X2 [Biomphalaria pfeifferi]|uniref:Ceramide kinase-like isoform X2 n=1 Tax=Biomphalaria pfeifferi TaxID=112525 RepID=A0AAD8BI15_BIOPF|nr:ceramide kinase-like isoform X2 [Biomphalaria pfeifferi]
MESKSENISQTNKETVNQNLEETVIFTEAVKIKGKENILTVGLAGLKVFQKSKEASAITFKWPDVLCIQPPQKCSETVLQYIHHKANNTLLIKTLQIQEISEQCVHLINQQIAASGRPKKLFVVINPFGGAGKGLQIYHEEAEPLFKVAGIETTVIVTERSKHATQIGESTDFSHYDGIVVVGGDGLYQELLHGLTLQEQKKSGINYDNPDTDLVKLNVPPIGIIPAGTGNGTTKYYNAGGFGAKTSVLNIIRGEQHRASVFGVYCNNKLFSISHLFVAYGMCGDLMKWAEELRWMKKWRYYYVILGQFLSGKRYFEAEVQYRPFVAGSGGGVSSSLSDWINLEPAVQHCYSIYAFPYEFVDTENKKYLDPFGQCCQLVVSSGCSQLSTVKSMVAVSKTSSPGNMEVVNNVKEFKVRLQRENATNPRTEREAKNMELEKLIIIDGELLSLDSKEFSVRLQTSFVPVFGTASDA